jgi:SAM-dependent methyltransferase
MHKSAYELMQDAISAIDGAALDVLDVGSLDVNGTYRPLVEARGWDYTGLDMRDGPNVDIVPETPFVYPFHNDRFDVVISGSTMEHVTAIWEWVPELVRVLKPGGTLIIITHHAFPLHRYPVDCWRIMPDGMAYLFERSGLRDWTIETPTNIDIIGIAKK